MADVTILDAWAQDISWNTQDVDFAPSAGNNRCVIVFVSGESNAGQQMGISTMSLGDQVMTEIDVDFTVGDTAAYHNLNSAWLLLEDEIAARTGDTITATFTGSPNDPFDEEKLFYACYENVNQTTPIGDHENNTNTSATSLSVSASITSQDGDKHLGFNVVGQHFAPGVNTGGWTEESAHTGVTNGHSAGAYHRTAVTGTTETPQFSSASATRMAVRAFVLQAETAAGATLTGVAATPAVGTVDKTHDQDLSGVVATPAVGSVTAGISVTEALTGVAATPAVGTLANAISNILSGVEASTTGGGGGQDYPVVTDTVTTKAETGVSSYSANYPATVNVNDLLIYIISNASTLQSTLSEAGTVFMEGSPFTTASYTSYYKRATGSEGGGSLTVSHGISTTGMCRIMRITNWDGTPPAFVPTAATGPSSTPNPGSLTPVEWDASTENTMWIAHCGFDGGRTINVYPSTYPDNHFDDTSASDSGLAIATRNLISASDDPGTFTMSSSGNWAANTIAVRGGGHGFPVTAQSIVTEQNTAVASYSANYPAGNIEADDLILIIAGRDTQVGNITITVGTALLEATSVQGHRRHVWYRKATGGEGGTTFTITHTTADDIGIVRVIHIKDWDDTVPPEIGSFTQAAANTAPDPPNLAPSWGSDKNQFWEIISGNGGILLSSYSTGYDFDQNQDIGTIGVRIGSANKIVEAASDNPDAGTFSASEDWQANTLAVKPRAAGGGGVGSVTPGTSVDLTGVLATTAVGTVTPPGAGATLSGVAATPAVGTVDKTLAKALTGVVAAAAVGAMIGNVTVALTGVEATPEVGNVGFTKSGEVALTGVVATPAVGNLSFTESGEVVLAGVAATPAVGTLGPVNEQDLTGVVATPAVGTVTPTPTFDLSGVAITPAVGSVDNETRVDLSGVTATPAVGSVGASAAGGATLSGVQSNAQVGNVGFTKSGTLPLTGVFATPAVGSVTAGADVEVELTGVFATFAVGNLGVQESGSVELTGVFATPAVGSLTNDLTVSLNGVEITGQVGNVGFTEAGSVGLTSVVATPAVGSVGFAKSGSVALTGVQATPAVGSVGIAATIFGDIYNAAAVFPTLSTVTIELFDPILGDPIALDDDSCEEIIGEGLFIWDSTKLTTQPTSSYQEYAWKMTDGSTTVGGIIRMGITVEDIFARVMENGETFAEQQLLIRANAAGSIRVTGAVHTVRDAADTKDRITATATETDRDVTAVDGT